MGCSTRGCKESDTTERLHFTSLLVALSRLEWLTIAIPC